MRFFSERRTPSENLALMGMMAGLNAIVALLASWLPMSSFLIVLFLPLASALVGELCQGKYLLPYALAASLVALAVTAYDLSGTLFYVIPAIISGTFYGFLIKKKILVAFLLFFSALLSLGLTIAALLAIKALYGVDMLEVGFKILGVAGKESASVIVPALLFGLSLASSALSHFFITILFPELEINYLGTGWQVLLTPLCGLFFGGLAIGFGFWNLPTAYLLLSFAIDYTVFSFLNIVRMNKIWFYAVGIVLVLLTFYLAVALYPSMPDGAGFLLMAIILFVPDGLSLIAGLLLRRQVKRTPGT